MLCDNPGKKFILAYCDNPDGLLHKFGTDSTEASTYIKGNRSKNRKNE